jgi:hypothetical protein
MILRVALRSLRARPVRSAVLAGGFGLGVAVMAVLLGVAAVILDQARAPALSGGGDVVLGGVGGRLPNARFILSSVLAEGPLASRVTAAAPSALSTLYLVDEDGATPVRARGGIPSLDRALGDGVATDRESLAAWSDEAADRTWTNPNPEDVLRSMDRFHHVPDAPAWEGSWAEWLYFNGRSADARFYLTFLSGPPDASGRRTVGVRLQLERNGQMASYSDTMDLDEKAVLAEAPDLTVGGNRVRLVGRDYRIALDLTGESGGAHATGDLVLHATPGRSLPPLTIRGADGWLSGYVVPVISGTFDGELRVGGERLAFEGAAGYHDHNWGFWRDVSWQWGQVQGQDVSFVYGRVYPPASAADPSRVPAFLMALGADGPLGYATNVTIDETNGADGRPQQVLVRARSSSLDVTLELEVRQTTMTAWQPGMATAALNFLQMRGPFQVSGRVGAKHVGFTAAGSGETFRGSQGSQGSQGSLGSQGSGGSQGSRGSQGSSETVKSSNGAQ